MRQTNEFRYTIKISLTTKNYHTFYRSARRSNNMINQRSFSVLIANRAFVTLWYRKTRDQRMSVCDVENRIKSTCLVRVSCTANVNVWFFFFGVPQQKKLPNLEFIDDCKTIRHECFPRDKHKVFRKSAKWVFVIQKRWPTHTIPQSCYVHCASFVTEIRYWTHCAGIIYSHCRWRTSPFRKESRHVRGTFEQITIWCCRF